MFVRSARRILAELRRLDEDLDLLSSPGGGALALGALPVAAAGVLPGVLTRLKAAYPAIRVRLQQGRTEELLPLLASGELDLIVGRLYEPAVPDGFAREALWTEPISVLARAEHPIFSSGAVTVEELRRYDLVLPTVTQRVGQEIEHLLSLLGIDPATSLRSSSYGFIREMLHGTDLLSVMPRLMMVGDLLRGTLRVVSLPIPAPDRPAGLILPRGRPLPAAGLGADGLGEMGDDAGVDRVGLGEPSNGAGELAHLARVDNSDRQTGLGQRRGDDALVAAAGFHGDEPGPQRLETADQIGQAVRVGGASERGPAGAHMHVHAALGDIDADEALGGRRLIHHPSSSMRARAQTTVRAYGQPAGATRSLAVSRTRTHSGYRPGSAGQRSNANQAMPR